MSTNTKTIPAERRTTNTTMKRPLPTDLRVQADPEHAGKYPLHDARFITQGPADLTDEDWHRKDTSIVATMTDCEQQRELARALLYRDAIRHLQDYLRPRRCQAQRKTDLKAAAGILMNIARSL